MLYFNCDYTEGAHPAILERLAETNLEQTVGYGEDEYCEKARAADPRRSAAGQDADVQFLVGGTQANFTVIRRGAAASPGRAFRRRPATSTATRPARVEATGHKVHAPCPAGRTESSPPSRWIEAVKAHWSDEARASTCVQPEMVYISHPTENGTLYTLAELEALEQTPAANYGLHLFRGRRPAGLRPDRRGSDADPAGSGPAVRRVLHRRHQGAAPSSARPW